jgi:hypothetical protein
MAHAGLALTVCAVTTPPAHAEDQGVDLVAVARAGARPKECGGGARARESRWERAKVPGLEGYCDALAKGYARLRAAPAEALALAGEAQRAMPARAAPLVLAARANVELGSFADGYAGFVRAVALSRASIESPGALHAFAIAAQRTGHVAEALDAYRALAPRAGLFDDAGESLCTFVEGAFLAMGQGPEHLTEAVGYLTEARRMPKLPEHEPYLLGALALAFDRQGRQSEAAGIASEAAGPWQLEKERGAPPKLGVCRPVLPAGELDAMIAMLAQVRDRDLALTRWQSYLDSDSGKSGPFAAHARARRDAAKRRAR